MLGTSCAVPDLPPAAEHLGAQPDTGPLAVVTAPDTSEFTQYVQRSLTAVFLPSPVPKLLAVALAT